MFFPPLVSLLSGWAAWHWGVYPDPGDLVSFGGAVSSVSVTMLGFMLAALAVLASINHTHLVGIMRKTGHFRDLLITLFTGCFVFLLCAIIGIGLLFGLPAYPWLMSVLVGIHVGGLVSLMDIGRKFWLVLINLHPDSPAKD